MLDTFHNEAFGGTGQTGDWQKFVRHQTAHPQKFWILAGGLNPANIGDAIAQTPRFAPAEPTRGTTNGGRAIGPAGPGQKSS